MVVESAGRSLGGAGEGFWRSRSSSCGVPRPSKGRGKGRGRANFMIFLSLVLQAAISLKSESWICSGCQIRDDKVLSPDVVVDGPKNGRAAS